MRLFSGLVAAAFVGWLSGSPVAQDGDTSSPRLGQLVVVGGGQPVPEIMRRALERAGGATALVVVVPQASIDPPGTAQRSVESWREAGAERVEWLSDLEAPEARRALRSADLIWFCGGSQTRLMSRLQQAGLVELIRERYRSGAMVGGTSAGAAVLSRVMIAGPAGPRGTPEAQRARVEEGLGLWPEVIIDQHFIRRNREGRLRQVVAEHPALLGVGIDEGTAVLVRGDELEVVGQSRVIVLAAKSSGSGPPRGPMGQSGPVDFESISLEAGARLRLNEAAFSVAAAR
ncbi:MAG: hypothetical protein KatS3mg108_2268 [Isosphaeraceae bacterium]|jgi:cyanophycinase|nr:MAG: hypothetical protein KatS3mg108_2268 [Isosphaeraceae bacterium]